MNIEQLEGIVEIAKTGSISEAAKNMNITIPALSQSLAQLEKELGILLFNRSRSGTVPTNEGKIIIHNANEVLRKLEQLKEAAQSITASYNGLIKIGNEPGVMPILMDIIADFKHDYPGVQFLLLETYAEEIIHKLIKKEIDFGFLSLTEYNKKLDEIVYEKITEGHLVIGANKQSAITLNESVTIEELYNYPIALFNDEHITRLKNDIEAKYGPLNIILTTNNLDSLRKVLLNNLAIMIGISYSFHWDDIFVPHANYTTVKLELDDDLQKHYTDFYFVRLKEKYYSDIYKIILEKFKSISAQK